MQVGFIGGAGEIIMLLKVVIIIINPHSRTFTDVSEVSTGGSDLIFQEASNMSFCLIMVVGFHGSNVLNARECLDLTKHIMNDREHVMNLTDVSKVRRGRGVEGGIIIMNITGVIYI